MPESTPEFEFHFNATYYNPGQETPVYWQAVIYFVAADEHTARRKLLDHYLDCRFHVKQAVLLATKPSGTT